MATHLLDHARIFIIEDNVANRAIMQLLLEQQGAEISYERWGTTTVQKLMEFMPVDVILMDLMITSKISGYDLFDEIRAIEAFRNVPIVAVSASDPSDAIPRTRAKGFDGFIAKPVDYDQFPKQIARILDDEQVWYAG